MCDGVMFHRDEGVLVNTCIRHVKDQAGIDLSRCTSWLRFVDIQYQRPSPAAAASEVDSTPAADGAAAAAAGDGEEGKGGDGELQARLGVGPEGYADGPSTAAAPQPNEVSVYFLCDVEACVPSEEDWPRVFAEQKAWRKAKAEAVEREQQAVLAEVAKKIQGKSQVRMKETESKGGGDVCICRLGWFGSL